MPDRPVKAKPIKREYPKRINNYRIPEDGALTPRLREKRSDLSLIGFHHHYEEKDDDA